MIAPPGPSERHAGTTSPADGYRAWREARDRAFSAHARACDPEGCVAAIANFLAAMRTFRDGLDEDDAALFDTLVRRDYEAMLRAEARAAGQSDGAALRRIVRRELAAGRLQPRDDPGSPLGDPKPIDAAD